MKTFSRWGISLCNIKKDELPTEASKFCYIGRSNRSYGLEESIFHNPFVLKSESEREDILNRYREYLFSNEELIKELPTLIGKNLFCWCSPKTCHGEVLVEALEKFYPDLARETTLKNS